MRHRSFVTLTVTIAILLFGSVAVYAYDSSHEDQIANGVKAGGIDIGGMKVSAARVKVRRELRARLNRPLDAVYHGRRFELTPREIRMRIDVKGMVADALNKSRAGNLISRTVRGVFGGKVNADIPVQATYSDRAVVALVKHVRARLNRRAQDASIDFSGGTLQHVKAQKGRVVKAVALRQDLENALAQPGGNRTVQITAVSTNPKVSTHELAAKYSTVITINRGAYQLTLYKHLKQVKTYPIAVGRQGLETPAGEYTVQDKQINPSWHVPNSSWAGSLAGQVIPPGPQDPIKARWIGVAGGAGIHGTVDTGSLGTSASHGCIRMSIPDVIELYDQTPYGSEIFIH
jgi:lipoprotein-anchoring transpeptidase ErfK/SrfK